jgi:hypothetical protein
MSQSIINNSQHPVRSIANKALVARKQGKKDYSIALWSLAKIHLANNTHSS